MRAIKKFNGNWNGRGTIHFYVGAYSRADAARMLASIECDTAGRMCKTAAQWEGYLRVYASQCWGTNMEEFQPVPTRGVWFDYQGHGICRVL